MVGIKPRTVFNAENRAYKSKQYPPFLGEQLALHDTVNVMYPELEELYLLQRSQTWTENEINLQQSRMDMIHSRQEEIDIMVKVVSYLWEADSVASRSILPVFAPFITNSELNEMMTEQTRFEVIHGKTYSEIVRQCVTDPQKVLDETMKNEEILSRTDTIIQAFDEVIKYGALYSLGSEYTNKDIPKEKYMEVILKGIFALYLLERIQFMSSFAVVFGLAERDRFKGIADLVKLISKDELCTTGEHSVLTPNGWVELKDLEDGVPVAQWDYDTNEIEFVVPSKVIRKKYTGDMVHITHSETHRAFDQIVTADHRLPLVNSDGSVKDKVRETTAINLRTGGGHHLPIKGNKVGGRDKLTDLERFKIAFQADGSFRIMPENNIAGKFTGCFAYNFSFAREHKIERLTEILDRLGFEYTTTTIDRVGNRQEMTKFYVKVPLDVITLEEQETLKNFSWVNISEVSSEWGREFVEELLEWDGSKATETRYIYSNNNKEAIDMVQTICHISNIATNINVTKAHVRESQGITINANDHYRLNIKFGTKVANGNSLNKEVFHVEDLDVYCVTVPSSFFLIKHNDIISVTGNCHATMMSTLINILRGFDDWNEVYESLIPEFEVMLQEVIDREFQWNKYLFSEGRTMVGLNTELLNEWVLYCAMDFCRQINFKYPYKKISTNPIPWVDNWIELDKVQNANQEADNINYRVNAMDNDLDDDEIFDI